MIDFEPLFTTLEEKGMRRTDLRKIIDGTTVAKLGKNKSVTLDTVDRICLYLDVPIEKVVRINR
ncbi:hypothetical protein JCM19037_1619 [Geomicrobium sp. JCM 19037]|uniref:helix-turn-helix domain-containing protein n=1 Tax=Geomicrobium sp. JCM 19037 TaxID=1460634 RepID=UPI00045F3F5C|nr:helix-turn-helix domain-containing protein [Geomicrobium sp. JCM 19037]GAK03305.1 hypothetical protein JCM19037_1619 [Geomicrobium sp. JCM 19037]